MAFKGVYRSFFNVISFGKFCNGKEKNISDIIKYIKKYKIKKKFDIEIFKLEEEKKINLFKIEYEEVKHLSYLSEYDKKIFISFNKIKKQEEEELKYLKNILINYIKNSNF